MNGPAPFGGGVFIADKSAWARSRAAPIASEWDEAIAARQIATCPVVMIELLYSARAATDFDDLDRDLRALRDVPVTRSVTQAAIAAMRTLAQRRPLSHRVPLPDLLVAACAQEAGIGVLHYDRHYDRLAEVLRFESRWLAPPGTLDWQ